MSKVAIAAARTGRIQRLSGETASKHVSVEGVKHHHFSQRQHSNRVTTTDILSVVSVPCEVSRTGSVHDSWTLEIPSWGSHTSHHGRKGLTITGYLVWALVRKPPIPVERSEDTSHQGDVEELRLSITLLQDVTLQGFTSFIGYREEDEKRCLMRTVRTCFLLSTEIRGGQKMFVPG